MKLRRLFSCMMALLLVCGLPLSALAEEYDLAKGSITVTAKADGQYVTQENGVTDHLESSPTVITQTGSETATTNTITITAEKNATAEVTLDGVNINTGNAAIQTKGGGDVIIELDGENTVQSGYYYAGIDKDNSGALVITNTDEVTEEDPGKLTATGGDRGAGIGGGYNSPDGNDISITGNAVVVATGGKYSAGIGGGHVSEKTVGDGNNITIEGNAHVTASGSYYGSGIGGGTWGDGNNITISGNAYVEATSGRSGAGIGGGCNGNGSNITISGNAQVKAQGGEIVTIYSNVYGEGAAIGNGGKKNSSEPGIEADIDTTGLEGGWVAKYENDPDSKWAVPDLDLEGKEVTSVTYRDENGQLQTATGDIAEVGAKAPTCTEAGHEAGYKIGDVLVAVTIRPKGHNVPGGYTPQNDATCSTLGTMTGYCIDCQTTVTVTDPNSTLKDHTFTTYKPDPDNLATCTEGGTKTAVCDVCKNATDTIPDPAKGHSFTDYVSDGNATYAEDGTKTAHCDHSGCTETHTIPDPGTRLPLYQVKGKDGARLPCREEKQDGVLTITVEADFATLTSALGGIQILKAQGIDTIVFVTNGATSTFALDDLLEQGSLVESFCLTHDAAAVTFTLGQATDISKILK